MLYERWREISAARRNQLALLDFASDRRWTFGELFAAGEDKPAEAADLVFPQGQSPEFILKLLAAWRTHKAVCPLESGQLPPAIPALPEKIVHLKSTSATAGGTKLVAFTAAQLMADAQNIVATMGLRPDWPNLGTISLAHSYGFSNLILPLLLHGIPLMLVPAPLPEMVRLAARKAGTVTLPAVPVMWHAWHQAGAIPPNTRLAISAGAPLALELEQEIFHTAGLKIHNFLGSSECGGIAYDAGETPRTDAAFIGRALHNVQLSLDESGCLVVQSTAVGQTYWPEPSPALGKGVFRTSDLAELKGGEVFLRGRLGDQINVVGRKISPEAIERVLGSHPQVSNCLVFGAPSTEAERSEVIVAIVVSTASETELKTFLRQSLPAWQIPRRWQFTESLQANSRGKLSRAEWRQRWLRENAE